MAQREYLGQTVFDNSINRLRELYREGHRLVVSFSGGKDSGIILELCIIAATLENRLPVDAVMRDEEIMIPETYEYCERVYNRPEVNMKWLIAKQPVINCFDRENPYFWVFDDNCPEKWVRQPPSFATYINEQSIFHMTIPERFPPAEGKDLYAVIGIRTQESKGRFYGLRSMKGHISKPREFGVRNVWPIYDWSDGDVWKAIAENKWDYNKAYDVLNRLGVPKNRLRIAPPTQSPAGADTLGIAANAYPMWFDKVSTRLNGVRAVAKFGKKAVSPIRKLGETWQETYHRECIEQAPKWIAERAIEARDSILATHKRHSAVPFPDVVPCYTCFGSMGSWKKMTEALYLGDPFAMKFIHLKVVEPEFFREGAGKWGGKPSF
mgnify:CR=1 FL=1|tara:strand:+ start:1568 stop:2707 length:1140 start_codon:yes stop_codon:yes gene_type:complete